MLSLPNWFVIHRLFSPCGSCDRVVLKAFFQRDADEEGRFSPHKAKLNNRKKNQQFSCPFPNPPISLHAGLGPRILTSHVLSTPFFSRRCHIEIGFFFLLSVFSSLWINGDPLKCCQCEMTWEEHWGHKQSNNGEGILLYTEMLLVYFNSILWNLICQLRKKGPRPSSLWCAEHSGLFFFQIRWPFGKVRQQYITKGKKRRKLWVAGEKLEKNGSTSFSSHLC